jgi:hypothetical protein
VPPDEPETRSTINPTDKDLVHEHAGRQEQYDAGLKSRYGMSGGREEECELESADPAKGIDEKTEAGSVLCGHENPSRRLPALSSDYPARMVVFPIGTLSPLLCAFRMEFNKKKAGAAKSIEQRA